MTPSDMLVLEAAVEVLDRHGYDSADLRGCIAAAHQANEDEAAATPGEVPDSPAPEESAKSPDTRKRAGREPGREQATPGAGG